MRLIAVDFVDNGLVKKRHINHAGYLVAPNSVLARSGILQYSAGSIGEKEGDPNRLVNVYRPPSEVMKIQQKYSNMPVTLQHPAALEVTPETARGLTVGYTGSKAEMRQTPDGEVEAVCDVVVTDKESIGKVESGEMEELSAGYYSSYKKQSGTAPDGTPYEYIQYNLIPNHVALVTQGRCGSSCKVADEKPKTKENHRMKNVIIAVDGKQFEVSSELADALQNTHLTADGDGAGSEGYDKPKNADQYDDPKKSDDMEEGKADDMEEEESEKTGDQMFLVELPNGQKATVDAAALSYLSSMESKTVDSAPTVDAMEIARLTASATKILGSKFDIATCDSQDSIKRQIVQKVLPAVDSAHLGDSVALDTLYQTAVKTFDSNADAFNRDQSFLGLPKKAADGNAVVSPVAHLLDFTGASKVADSAQGNDPFNPKGKRLQFLGKKGE